MWEAAQNWIQCWNNPKLGSILEQLKIGFNIGKTQNWVQFWKNTKLGSIIEKHKIGYNIGTKQNAFNIGTTQCTIYRPQP